MTKTASSMIFGGLLALVTTACDDEETSGSTGSTSHDHESHGTHDHEDHGTTEHDHGTTGHDGDGTTEPGTSEPGSTGAGTTGEGYMPPSAEEYCACMLDLCHDLYHSTWGEDHVRSEQMCIASYESSPIAGMPAMEGNSQECRVHHCQAAARDESLCESAMGGGACQ